MLELARLRSSPSRKRSSQDAQVSSVVASVIPEALLLRRSVVLEWNRTIVSGRQPKLRRTEGHACMLPVRVKPPIRPEHAIRHVVDFALALVFCGTATSVNELRLAQDLDQMLQL